MRSGLTETEACKALESPRRGETARLEYRAPCDGKQGFSERGEGLVDRWCVRGRNWV